MPIFFEKKRGGVSARGTAQRGSAALIGRKASSEAERNRVGGRWIFAKNDAVSRGKRLNLQSRKE